MLLPELVAALDEAEGDEEKIRLVLARAFIAGFHFKAIEDDSILDRRDAAD